MGRGLERSGKFGRGALRGEGKSSEFVESIHDS